LCQCRWPLYRCRFIVLTGDYVVCYSVGFMESISQRHISGHHAPDGRVRGMRGVAPASPGKVLRTGGEVDFGDGRRFHGRPTGRVAELQARVARSTRGTCRRSFYLVLYFVAGTCRRDVSGHATRRSWTSYNVGNAVWQSVDNTKIKITLGSFPKKQKPTTDKSCLYGF